jgi:Xaa-Pro aminopeptidase
MRTADPTSTASHDSGPPAELLAFMTRSWASPGGPVPTLAGKERYAMRRRDISRLYPGDVLVVPTGREKVRANDTTYRFRPGTDFYYLTGNVEPDCVLLMVPSADGHRDLLFTEPNPGKTDGTFFTDRSKGELWVGPRLGIEATAERYGVTAKPLTELAETLRDAAAGRTVRTLRGLDTEVEQLVWSHTDDDAALATALSELRLIKDELEIAELRNAIASTKRGFDDVIRALPNAVTERVVEGVFGLRARVEGNDVGYGTIAASGPDACILHWVRNDRRIASGDLLLLDAGVEGVSLYTADVTRSLPVSGTFTAEQREIYTLVWEAQQAAFGACKNGNDFLAPNDAAMKVLAHGLERLGILESAETALEDDKQFYKRYSLHNVSHMLGLDVHDCAKARAENYRYARLQAGMVLTIEPGLYLQPDDLTVPERYRGIGVRIEDDIVITYDGYDNLTSAFPSTADDVEAWVRELRGTTPEPWVIPA